MPNLYVARRAPRKGVLLEMGGTNDNPNLMFVVNKKMERSELDELVRAQLARQGITKDSDVEAILTKSETEYEQRIKNDETIKEVRRLMAIRANGGKLMQVGFRKWKQVFYRPIK